jgi:tRNA-binding protein
MIRRMLDCKAGVCYPCYFLTISRFKLICGAKLCSFLRTKIIFLIIFLKICAAKLAQKFKLKLSFENLGNFFVIKIKIGKMPISSVENFFETDIRSGTIVAVEAFPKARKPAWKLTIDFGSDLGLKRSSAQIVQLYAAENLVGRQVLAVVNFPPRQIADFISEVLVLGLETSDGVVLLQPERPVENGVRVS